MMVLISVRMSRRCLVSSRQGPTSVLNRPWRAIADRLDLTRVAGAYVKDMCSPRRREELGRIVEGYLRDPQVSARIAQAAAQARCVLASDGNRLAGTVPIEESVFESELPIELQSCRLSVMRGGSAYKIERHPNGTQFVYSLEEAGTISVFDGESWATSSLTSDPTAPLASRWHVVPANTWHQPVPGARDWVVLAFHSAPAHELIDEYDYRGPLRSA